LSKATFTAITSVVGAGFSVASEFETGMSVTEISSALIIYNQATGALVYNQNGTAAGLGNGGQFAVLNTNNGPLSASNFVLV
jgi:Ca2+-binding RTX toxin-like protein